MNTSLPVGPVFSYTSVIRVVRVILTHTLTRQVYRDSRRPRRIFLCDFFCGFYTIGPIGLSA
jgi:hypothetical protein